MVFFPVDYFMVPIPTLFFLLYSIKEKRRAPCLKGRAMLPRFQPPGVRCFPIKNLIILRPNQATKSGKYLVRQFCRSQGVGAPALGRREMFSSDNITLPAAVCQGRVFVMFSSNIAFLLAFVPPLVKRKAVTNRCISVS